MPNLMIVICSRDVEAVFIKGKILFYQQTRSSSHFQTGKDMVALEFQKSIMVEANIVHVLCDTAALTRHCLLL